MTTTKKDITIRQLDLIANIAYKINNAGLEIRQQADQLEKRRKGFVTLHEEDEIQRLINLSLSYLSAAGQKLKVDLANAREGKIPPPKVNPGELRERARREMAAKRLKKESASEAAKRRASDEAG